MNINFEFLIFYLKTETPSKEYENVQYQKQEKPIYNHIGLGLAGKM